MTTLNAFLDRIVTEPDPTVTWLVLADWLEEQGDPRYELVRLLYQPAYRPDLSREQRAQRLRALLDCVPPLFENTLNAHFAWVPPGTFWMGGGGGKPGEKQVRIEQGFALSVFPVTQGQWQEVMGENPSYFSRDGEGMDKVKDIKDEELQQFPVETVSWNDAQKFIKKLNKKEQGRGYLYRLPSEAEWEYACRGGAISEEASSYDFSFDQPTNDLSSTQANFNGDYPSGKAKQGPYLGRTTRVGSYRPNSLGLYDMHGNVWEWCSDRYEEGASGRVIRGGSWSHDGRFCRASFRSRCEPSDRDYALGFRLARSSVRAQVK